MYIRPIKSTVCKRGNIGWEVDTYDNPVGKIPVLLFEQDPEHSDVQPMIERLRTPKVWRPML